MSSIYLRIFEAIPHIIGGVLVFSFFVLIAKVGKGVSIRMCKRVELDEALTSFISKTLYYSMILIGTITALGTFGVDVTALVAGLGLSGFAIGFALKDAISNLLSGILILVYRPFSIGSYISVGAFEGEVVEINMRYTILSNKDKKVMIPNSNLFTMPVTLKTGRKTGS